MQTNTETITAARVRAEYDKGVQFNNGLNLYEDVKQCENFVEGRQWEGLKTKTLRPITMNVLDPIVHYKVAQIVSNDVDQDIEPFLPDEQAEHAAKILEQSIDRVVERSKLKSMHHSILRDACVDGDACFYVHFDPALETGQAVKGDIAVDLIDSTNICFGNPACDEVQRQPYIIIAMRRDVDEVRREARENGRRTSSTPFSPRMRSAPSAPMMRANTIAGA